MIKSIPALTLVLVAAATARADHSDKILYRDVVAPILTGKCVSCHGEEKSKGKLRLDSLDAIFKGGYEGPSVVAGDPMDGSMMFRIHLPLDDDEHMPPEDKEQLSEEEVAILEFWIKSGADGDATIGSLKASAELTKAIAAVLTSIDEGPAVGKEEKKEERVLSAEDEKRIADTMKVVNEGGGGNLMPIAQNTPDLRFSALNVAGDFRDEHLRPLETVGEHVYWLDLARTQVTDEGLASLRKMPNVTRLHLEKTGISDQALDHVAQLPNLEYLNLYGTSVTDAGIAKLARNQKLRKLFLWQTSATGAGVEKLAKAIPGVDINTGWEEPIPVAASEEKEKKGAAPAAPVKNPEPQKKATPPQPKKEDKPAAASPKQPEVKKEAAKAAPAEGKKGEPEAAGSGSRVKGSLEKALAELESAAEVAKKESAEKRAAYEAAVKRVEQASRDAENLKLAMERAAETEKRALAALQALIKAVESAQ